MIIEQLIRLSGLKEHYFELDDSLCNIGQAVCDLVYRPEYILMYGDMKEAGNWGDLVYQPGDEGYKKAYSGCDQAVPISKEVYELIKDYQVSDVNLVELAEVINTMLAKSYLRVSDGQIVDCGVEYVTLWGPVLFDAQTFGDLMEENLSSPIQDTVDAELFAQIKHNPIPRVQSDLLEKLCAMK